MQNNSPLQDETFIAGESRTINFEVKDELGLPLDLTLFSVSVKVCPLGEKSYTILTKTGTIDSDPKTGKFSIKLVPSDTLEWDEGYYTFQAIITQTIANEYRIEGTWYVKGAIQ